MPGMTEPSLADRLRAEKRRLDLLFFGPAPRQAPLAPAREPDPEPATPEEIAAGKDEIAAFRQGQESRKHEAESLLARDPGATRPASHVGLDDNGLPVTLSALILRQVAKKHGVKISDLKGPSRENRFTKARFEACYRLKEEAAMSFPRIGRILGGRDHTTALSGYRRWREYLETGNDGCL